MTLRPPRQYLCLLLADHGMTVASVAHRAGQWQAGPTSWFELPDRLTSLDAEALGARLREHLRANHHAASPVLVGVPGLWLMARHHAAPPVDDQAMRGIVQLQVESAMGGMGDELVFDYQDAPADGEHRGALILGMRSDRLAKLRAVVAAAKLKLHAVTPTPLSVTPPTQPGLTVLLEPGCVTLLKGAPDGWSAMTSFHTPASQMTNPAEHAQLLSQMTWRLATMSGEVGQVRLVDAAAIGDHATLEQLAGLIRQQWGGCQVSEGDLAVRLVQAMQLDPAPANFADPRLQEAPKRQLTKPMQWGILAAGLAVLLGLGGAIYWRQQAVYVRDLQTQLDAISDEAGVLQQVLDRTRMAEGWFDDRPPLMECLLELSQVFPDRGRIWTMHLSLDDLMFGALRGRAGDRQTMMAFLNAMQQSPKLSDVELRDWAETGRDTRVVVFEITFRFDAGAGGDS